jgi:hypothetical protein
MKDTSYITEAIQVAAVAAAMAEDEMFGESSAIRLPDRDKPYQVDQVLALVRAERKRQDEKWGPQHHDKLTWLFILMEEVGELAEEIGRPDQATEAYPFTRSTYDMIVHAGQRSRAYLEHRFCLPEIILGDIEAGPGE